MVATRSWRLIVAILAMVLFLHPARAHAGTATDGALATCIARVQPGHTPADVFRRQVPLDCGADQYRHGSGDFWALSAELPNRTADAPYRVRIGSVWQDRLTLHALYADGKVAILSADSRALSRHIQFGAIVEFAVPRREAPLRRLLWKVEGSANQRGVILDQQIVSDRASQRSNIAMAALFAGFVGLAFGLLVYNFALWSALRHRFQLVYCAMVAALLVYATSSSGALAWLVDGLDNNDRLRLNYVMLGWSAAAAIGFARCFFEPKVFAGWLGRAASAAILLAFAAGPTFAIVSRIDMPVANTIYAWTMIGTLSITMPVLWRAWQLESRYLWLFALAWAAPIAFAAARLLAAVHVIGASFWLDNSTVFSMAIEALISSLAIAYRVQMLRSERDEAVAAETIARHLAGTDALTGLLNRRAFLDQAIGRSGAQTLHVIDIDHFKRVNDTLGHDGGDEVLRVFARVLRAIVPGGALVARFGGEEFALITAASLPLDADTVLARLRAERMPFSISVTASIGSCTGPLATESDWKTLYRNADLALFEAKSGGRNRAHRSPLQTLAA